MARWFVAGFGIFVIAVGAWTVVQPSGLQRFGEQFLTEGGFWVAVVLRLTVGALLWITASASRTPGVLKFLGALFFLSGIGIAIVGLERMQPIVEWGAGLEPAVLRTVGLVAAGLGAFIVWSVWPRRRES
jgi:hypothetical protein